MTEAEIIHWFSLAWPGPLMRGTDWQFGFSETLHFMGLCLLFGALIVVDVRLLGFFKELPVKAVLPFIQFAIIGFLINLATGWSFFTSNPSLYWGNPAFRMKLLLILLAGINALVFTVVEHRRVALLPPGEDTPALTKITAALSLSLWTGVLVFGRLLPIFTLSVN